MKRGMLAALMAVLLAGCATPGGAGVPSAGQAATPTTSPTPQMSPLVLDPGAGVVVDPADGFPLPETTAPDPAATQAAPATTKAAATKAAPATTKAAATKAAPATTKAAPATTEAAQPAGASKTSATIVSKNCAITSGSAVIVVRVSDPANSGYKVTVGVNGRSKTWNQSGSAQFTYSNPNQTSVTGCVASIS